MIDETFLEEHFYNKYYELDEKNILELNTTSSDPRINNVIKGLHLHCYGLAIRQDTEKVIYDIYYINRSIDLKGDLIKLDLHDNNRDNLLLVFCKHVAKKYDLDVVEVFNTFQDATRSMCEQLDFFTMTANELKQYKDQNPTIVAKNVRGIIILPFLEHSALYQSIFGSITIPLPKDGADFVYLMHNKRNNLIKIGKSRNPRHREKTLQAEEPEITMIAVWHSTAKLERHLHKLYKGKRLRGEWFKLDFEDLKRIEAQVNDFITQSV